MTQFIAMPKQKKHKPGQGSPLWLHGGVNPDAAAEAAQQRQQRSHAGQPGSPTILPPLDKNASAVPGGSGTISVGGGGGVIIGGGSGGGGTPSGGGGLGPLGGGGGFRSVL